MAERVRTPRRRKVWLQRRTFIDISTPASPSVIDEPLAPGLTAMGIESLGGLTLMRCFGRLTLIAGGDATTPAWDWFRVGLIWVTDEIANSGASATRAPEPLQDGVRQDRFIQQWELGAVESNLGLTGIPLNGSAQRNGYESVEFDFTQMAKQPTVNHRMILMGTGGTLWEAGTVDLDIQMSFMVALP